MDTPATPVPEPFRVETTLPADGETYNYTAEELREYVRCSEDPVYFIRTYMKIIQVDTSGVGTSGKARVIYQILDKAGNRVATGEQYLGKAQGFYADDPNWQTLPVLWITGSWHATFNNVTVSGVGNPIPGAPQGLK